MRDFLNSILTFIGTATLSDMEYDSIELESATYDQQSYLALSQVLQSREAVSTIQSRLVAFYKARGVDVDPHSVASSNILLGMVLD